MKYSEFANRLETLQQAEDAKNGRVYNMDKFGHWVRILSRRLTYIFYRIGLHGPHILMSHFIVDVIALVYVFQGMPLSALVAWLISYVLDNCDGDLARARDEADPIWGVIDNVFHTYLNMIFWLVLAFITDQWILASWLLAFRVIMEHYRRGFAKPGDRYGERSKIMKWIALPTDINIMYIVYVPFAYFGMIPLAHFGYIEGLELYMTGYLIYYALASTGQLIVLEMKAMKVI